MGKGGTGLKVVSIIMVVCGIIAIFFSILALVEAGLLAASPDDRAGIQMLALALALVGAAACLAGGIVGMKAVMDPEKTSTCIAIGIIAIALTVASNTIMITLGFRASVLTCATGIAVPVYFIVLAYMNRKRLIRQEVLSHIVPINQEH